MPYMRYVIDLPVELVDEVNKLISSGRYRTIQDFLAAAASNQIQLEQHDVQSLVQSVQQSTVQVAQQGQGLLFQLLSPDFGDIHTLSQPEPEQVAGELYGLWNRFFPVKVTTRVLANILKGDGSEVPLDSAQERAADVARQLGRQIFRKERDIGRKRGDMIATALPWKREEFKAKTRFKTHFVGYLSKNGIEGEPAALRFVNIRKSESNIVIGLTAAGVKFSGLVNPVIDKEDYSASLSQPERAFLMDHIRIELPAEAQLMKSVLEAVKGGAANPSMLHRRLAQLRPKLNETELVTLRSGLLGRMYELDLVQRTREGLSMTYQVTPAGEEFLRSE